MDHKEIFEEIFKEFEMGELEGVVYLPGDPRLLELQEKQPEIFKRMIASADPTSGQVLAYVMPTSLDSYEKTIEKAQSAFLKWRMTPAPKRGEVIRFLEKKLRKHKEKLAKLVSIEMGKIISEGEGEVQEMIDACWHAAGLSRMLYGLTMPSERPGHSLEERWHPLGPVGVITAFNFPAAVWSWNAAIAVVCGDVLVWKPSSLTPLSAIAIHQICRRVEKIYGLNGVFNLVIGAGQDIGEKLINDPRIKLISATGSCEMGKKVKLAQAKILGQRPPILELGGNNAVIIMDDIKNDEVLERIMYKAILFGAVGTAGQRCTTIRRLLIHEKVFKEVLDNLVKLYKQIKIGDPLESEILMGPLVSKKAVDDMTRALEVIKNQGGSIIYGGGKIEREGFFVRPAIVVANTDMPIVKEETFAPILYCLEIKNLEEGIRLNNSVPQGLSSSIFTNNLRNAKRFLAAEGSDCGIANVNMGTSGAEIGGAFGGEKETGSGSREMGSDSWKQYMRRQTITINYGEELPLSQGVKFDLEDKKEPA